MVEKGLCTRDQVEEALAVQSKQFKKNHTIRRIDDTLADSGMLDAEAVDDRDGSQNDPSSISPKANPRTQATVRSGEDSPDYRDAFSLSVSDDKLSASIIKKRGIERELSLSDIKSFLKTNGILHGTVDDDTLQAFLDQPADPEKPFKIAEGTEPVSGRDAKVTYYFTTDRLKRDMIQHSECVEFSPPEDNLSVKAGDILAEKIPLISPKPGVDVFGRQMPFAEVKDYPLSCGEGVVLSGNGLKIIAEVDGQSDLTLGGKILVLSDLRSDLSAPSGCKLTIHHRCADTDTLLAS